MYNIDLKENEEIIYNNDEAKILSENQVLEVSLVITNNRLIILEDATKLGNLNNLFRTVKRVSLVPNREIIFQTLLNEIKDIISDKYIKIILNNNDFIEINDKNIIDILKK